jgi:hypothetical protein
VVAEGPSLSSGVQKPGGGSDQDAPWGLRAGALLRALLLPLAQVLTHHLLHSVLGE